MPRSYFDKERESLPPFGTLIRVPEPEDQPRTVARRKLKMKRNVTQISVRDSKSRADKEETTEDNGVWFLVNKNGFPIDEITWNRMWDHVAKIHPEGPKTFHCVRGNSDLPQVIWLFLFLYIVTHFITMHYSSRHLILDHLHCTHSFYLSLFFKKILIALPILME